MKRLLAFWAEPGADDGAAGLRDRGGEEFGLLRGEPGRRRQLACIRARDGSRVGVAGQDQLAAERGHPRATMLAQNVSPAKPLRQSARPRLVHAPALAGQPVAGPLQVAQRGRHGPQKGHVHPGG